MSVEKVKNTQCYEVVCVGVCVCVCVSFGQTECKARTDGHNSQAHSAAITLLDRWGCRACSWTSSNYTVRVSSSKSLFLFLRSSKAFDIVIS